MKFWKAFTQWQANVTSSLKTIITYLETLMAKATDLQGDLDAIKALVQKQADAIATLSAAAPGVMTQEQLDALDAEAKAILATTAVDTGGSTDTPAPTL